MLFSIHHSYILPHFYMLNASVICSSLQMLLVLWLTKARSLPTLTRCELNSILVEGLYANVQTATGSVLFCLVSRHWLITWQQTEYKKIQSVPLLPHSHLWWMELDWMKLDWWSGTVFWGTAISIPLSWFCILNIFIMLAEELYNSVIMSSWILIQGLSQLDLKG